MNDQVKPKELDEQQDTSNDLLVAVNKLKQARNRDSSATDDGGSTGRSDTNDNTIF